MLFKDIVESNGKTIEQNNLSCTHKYPIGTLVQFSYESCFGPSVVKMMGTLWVMEHTRDCDGSPLYHLGSMDLSKIGNLEDFNACGSSMNRHARTVYRKGLYDMILNMGEESLTPA